MPRIGYCLKNRELEKYTTIGLPSLCSNCLSMNISVVRREYSRYRGLILKMARRPLMRLLAMNATIEDDNCQLNEAWQARAMILVNTRDDSSMVNIEFEIMRHSKMEGK
jgi:hypothetical protein